MVCHRSRNASKDCIRRLDPILQLLTFTYSVTSCSTRLISLTKMLVVTLDCSSTLPSNILSSTADAMLNSTPFCWRLAMDRCVLTAIQFLCLKKIGSICQLMRIIVKIQLIQLVKKSSSNNLPITLPRRLTLHASTTCAASSQSSHLTGRSRLSKKRVSIIFSNTNKTIDSP